MGLEIGVDILFQQGNHVAEFSVGDESFVVGVGAGKACLSHGRRAGGVAYLEEEPWQVWGVDGARSFIVEEGGRLDEGFDEAFVRN